MLVSGTLTMAVFYIMMLSDSMIAGYFIGENGVAAINAVTPVTGVVSFFMTVISIGSGIVYSREIGAMRPCVHRVSIQVFEHNFVDYKAKICWHTVVWQGFLTQ